jgi:uncharacterized lipoprotein YajG
MKTDTSAYDKAFHMLNQFNAMKKIAGNLSFKHFNVEILCTEIMADIIDEIRRERKIAMTIRDAS